MEYGFLSIIPPLIAVLLAIWSRQVLLSLFTGLLLGWMIIQQSFFLGIIGSVEALVAVFKSEGNTRTIIFTLMIGALIQLIKYSGGVNGFIRYIQQRIEKKKNPANTLQVMAGFTGFLLFIESNISILTVGTVFRPLFQKFSISRQKLAYLADSSSAPSCILFPLNAWGAYIMGLLVAYESISPFQTLIYAIPLNFYALLTLITVFIVASRNINIGPMKQFEEMDHTDKKTAEQVNESGKMSDMIVPLLAMVISMPCFLIYSGWTPSQHLPFGELIWQSIGNGSGSFAVLMAVLTGITIAVIKYALKKTITIQSFMEESIKGMNEMLSMAILMVMAFAIGNLCNELGTGAYVASITSQWIIPPLIPAIVFITSCFIAFSTGTSWGTFAIMISIAVPLSLELDLNIYLIVAAVLGGGVFGDHCSPISDTTLIASIASGSDHIDHVRTQLPYALFTGLLSLVLYIIAGFLL